MASNDVRNSWHGRGHKILQLVDGKSLLLLQRPTELGLDDLQE